MNIIWMVLNFASNELKLISKIKYRTFSGLRVLRGCVSNMEEHEKYHCLENGKTCNVCFGNGCNRSPNVQEMGIQRCYVCNSKKDGNDCLRRPERLKKETCSNDCYTKVENEYVLRGCVGDEAVPKFKDCDRDPETCKSCAGDKCNNLVITPTTCISCDSTVDKTCATNSTSDFDQIDICPITSIYPQKCYHFINQTSGQHARGKYCYNRNSIRIIEIRRFYRSLYI